MALFNFTFNIMASQSQLEFVNIEVLKDNLIFLNGRAIANSTDSKYAKMRNKLLLFSRKAISILSNPNINQKRSDLKVHFHGFVENSYTRLGFCENDISGNGVGNGKLKDVFIDTLIYNQAFQNGAITHISQFDIVIENINIDRISDATTKVLAKELCVFTIDQCNKWNVSQNSIKGFEIEYFDDKIMDWKKDVFQLPFNLINGKEVPIILIPKIFCTDQNNSNRTLNHLVGYIVESKLKPEGYFKLLNVPKSGKNGNSISKDYKGVFKQDQSIKEAISSFLSKTKDNILLLNFASEKKNQIDCNLTDEEITNIISIRRKIA